MWIVFRFIEHRSVLNCGKHTVALKWGLYINTDICTWSLRLALSVRNSIHTQKREERLMGVYLHLAFAFVTLYLQAVRGTSNACSSTACCCVITFLSVDASLSATDTRMNWYVMFRGGLAFHLLVSFQFISHRKQCWTKYLRCRHVPTTVIIQNLPYPLETCLFNACF
jgi:hypothetical protein